MKAMELTSSREVPQRSKKVQALNPMNPSTWSTQLPSIQLALAQDIHEGCRTSRRSDPSRKVA